MKRTTAEDRAHRTEVYGLKPGSVPVARRVIRHRHNRPLASMIFLPLSPCACASYHRPATSLADLHGTPAPVMAKTAPALYLRSVPHDAEPRVMVAADKEGIAAISTTASARLTTRRLLEAPRSASGAEVR